MKPITIALIALALVFSAALAVAEDMRAAELKTYDVARVTLTQPVTRTVEGKTVTLTEGYLVRLHGRFPIGNAIAMQVRIGDETIEEYGGLPGGLYFIVYDPAGLARMTQKPIQYRFNKTDSWHDMGQAFDPSSFDLTTAHKEIDALKAGE